MARLLDLLMTLQAGLPLLDFSMITGKKKLAYFRAVRAGRPKLQADDADFQGFDFGDRRIGAVFLEMGCPLNTSG
jgi:hypothetical protein